MPDQNMFILPNQIPNEEPDEGHINPVINPDKTENITSIYELINDPDVQSTMKWQDETKQWFENDKRVIQLGRSRSIEFSASIVDIRKHTADYMNMPHENGKAA
jgi:hypothetical protein